MNKNREVLGIGDFNLERLSEQDAKFFRDNLTDAVTNVFPLTKPRNPEERYIITQVSPASNQIAIEDPKGRSSYLLQLSENALGGVPIKTERGLCRRYNGWEYSIKSSGEKGIVVPAAEVY